MTNEERIKSLSTEELADEFRKISTCWACPLLNICSSAKSCREKWKQWLKSEVEEWF